MRFLGIGVGIFVLVSLAHAQAPAVNAGGVVNDGNFSAQGVAPGSIVAIFGTNLASQIAVGDTIPLSTTLGSVISVTFNGIPAGEYFVGPFQINAQLPWNVLPQGTTTGDVDVVVTTNTGSSAPQTVHVLPVNPGIFTVSATGLGQAIATDNNDGLISAPAGSIAGITTHPISISSGHALIVWCTGMGQVDAPIANGANSLGQLLNTLAKPTVLVGGVPAQFIYSILAPQYVSENQIAVVLAPNTPTGNAVTLQIVVNGVTTSDQVTIAVTN
jgi:uncharacterized protein (TIGR03437 family)